MTEEEEQSNLFDEKLLEYEKRLVEIILNISESKRVNPKVGKIACYLLIHEKLTQKEIKELTGFSMGTISTYLSVLVGTGFYLKQRIEGTHTFEYSYSGKLEVLTTQAVELTLSSIGFLENFLKNKMEKLKALVEQSKEGAEHLLIRIEELIDSFEIYKFIYPTSKIPTEKIDKKLLSKSIERLTNKQEKVKEIKFDEEVYPIEDEILDQLLASPMYSTRDPMFIRILGYFLTRKYLTQKTLKNVTGLSVGKISEEVNQLLDNELVHIAHTSDKGKITYCADSLILLRFSRHIINRMIKWEKHLENIKLELEKNKSKIGTLKGFSQLYRISNYVLSTISEYSGYINKIDEIVEL